MKIKIQKASGVAILSKANLNVEIVNLAKDQNGQILKYFINLEQETFQ